MARITLEQKSQISQMGEQLIIVIQKSNHKTLNDKGFLNRKLNVSIDLETL